jgi:hypothetical protein
MNIEEKYLSKKNKFNIDRKIIFETKNNLEKIKNNNEMRFLYKYIIKMINKIDEKENKYKFYYEDFNNKLINFRETNKRKFKLMIKSKKFINREKKI